MTNAMQLSLLSQEESQFADLPSEFNLDKAQELLDVSTLAEKAIGAIKSLFLEKMIVAVAFSGGKDSSVLMHLTILAAKAAKTEGFDPNLVITSSDTGMENPEMLGLLLSEHSKIKACLTKAEIQHKVIVARPSLATSWPVRVLGGNKLPTFPGQASECSVALKVQPMERVRKQIYKKAGETAMVTLIGTRYEESERRRAAMLSRGELADRPYANAKGELVMSPLAYWTTDDVWEQIAMVKNGFEGSYTDFEDLFDLYADAGGTSCAVVSDAISEGIKKERSGCGARTGCHSCLVVHRDTSLETMINSNPAYEYMRGLNQFRNLLAKYRWDYTRRYWVMRSIKDDGTVKLAPDCFSPAYLLELFRYAASLDACEKSRARVLKIKPRFQILGLREVVAIDATWSLNGYHKPHTALLEWIEIEEGRKFYSIPNVEDLPDIPQKRINHESYFQVGSTWDGEESKAFTGYLDALRSFAACVSTRTLDDGREVPLFDSVGTMDVDVESAVMAIDFEFDSIKKRHDSPSEDWTDGYRFWASYGALQITPQQQNEHDLILRRTNWRSRNGLIGEEGNQKAMKLAMEFALT